MNVQNLISEKIVDKEAKMIEIKNEIRGLKEEEKETAHKTGLKAWIGYDFISSSGTTEEWVTFSKEYKRELKKSLPVDFELADFMRGHFYVSGFIKNRTTDKYAYFSISDVRGGQDGFYNDILIRTAQGVKDYTGGSNCFTTFDNFVNALESLTK